ncbi:hypothetical protein RGU12_00080 [Fredinandcohnia sp. QZ13]|uniref:hypothetical protein n=1 Tax=Fredinandcohnia sp. QZ13 TaxID=3073144 RepID=UPI0028532881|nr:hypothetical protein [Fredinandcohnia sp. QZ13]MDR4885940.1 hypothetical protein [Fredinandcohnia sp. QZ13]
MIKRSVGISFIAISTILIAVKYLSKAIGGAPVGNTISTLSLLSLLAGLCYLSWGEFDEYKKGIRHSGK